jgi:hypothetical protein
LSFGVPDDYYAPENAVVDDFGRRVVKVPAISWFTNLDHAKRHEELPLWKKYTHEEYPRYDNYDAINVDKVKDIPRDYDGAIGVPITFLDKWNPDQFEILDANLLRQGAPLKPHGLIKDKDGAIGGKPKYARMVIRQVIAS